MNMLWQVKIKGDSNGKAKLSVNGERVEGLIGYKIEQNGYDKRIPVLILQVMCDVEIDNGVICPLPKPWSMSYECKDGTEITYQSEV